ncbi:MAG TPA: sorbosone dehydrogenase family protein [Mucilaginibacter sp.]|nr:sorbosone dehydrogenase family protein [Mucilaginibacter sp.]
MIKACFVFLCAIMMFVLSGCSSKHPDPSKADQVTTPVKQKVHLPPPYQTKATWNFCDVIGWPKGKTPIAPPGFQVNLFADSLNNPRNMIVTPNGDILVAEANTEITGLKKIGADIIGASASQNLGKSANRVTLLRDTDHDGVADIRTVFLSHQNHPFGMLIFGHWFYVANTDALWRFPYMPGMMSVNGGQKILSLPAGGYNNHWTRNLRMNSDSTKIYISVGSGTNDGEHGMDVEKRRADILEIDPDGRNERVYASGLRNPAGIDIEPGTNVLFTTVNERDDLGDNLVPDYLTSVKDGGFYGWPYAYFGHHDDPDHLGERPDLVKKSLVPDLALGAHTACLGLAFYTGTAFPAKYRHGAFISQHGSWNRSELAGYKVVFVPFAHGKPTGKIEDFLTGFIADRSREKVYGRPVGITILPDGSMLVADDTSNRIWRVATM